MAATVNDIRSIVQDLWSFFVPPIGRILVALLILVFVGGGGLLLNIANTTSSLLTQLDQVALLGALDKFSLTPLVPVIGLFIFGFLIFAIDRLLQLLPGVVPVSLVWSDSALYGLHRRLGSIWRLVPGAEDAGQVLSVMEQQLAAERGSPNKVAVSNVDSWVLNNDRCFNQQRFIRFIIAWTVVASTIVALVGGPRSLRLTVAISLLVLCLVALSWSFLRAAEILDQLASAKVDAFEAIVINQGRKPLDPSDHRWTEIERFVDAAEGEAAKGWWWLSLFRFEWAKMARHFRRRRSSLLTKWWDKIFGRLTPNSSAAPDANRASRGHRR